MAYTDQVAGSRRFTTLAAVGAIHVALGYALVTGMAVDFMRNVGRTLITTNVPLPVPPRPDPTPPPPTEHAATATRTQPTTITFVHPLVETPAADARVTVDPAPLPPLPQPLPLPAGEPYVAPSPTPNLSSVVAVRGNRSAWITNDDYPASSINAEEQGTVALTVQVDAAGRVTSCSVTASSGSPALDRTTCRLYAQRARFTPARDGTGQPTASSYSDRVRWVLPR